MKDSMMDTPKGIEVDMIRLVRAVFGKIWLVILAAIIGATVFGLVTFFLVTPQYESSAMFYVNNNSLSVGDASFSISSSDITASKSLVDSYIVILQTRETLLDVIDYAGVSCSVEDVRKMITASSVESTEIFEVVVTGADPYEAERLATAIAYILPKRISSIIEGTSAKVVDSAIVPVKPSSPSYPLNIALGFVLGLVMSVSIVVLEEMFSVKIQSEEDVLRCTSSPILTSVPDMMAQSKGNSYYVDKDGKKDGTAANKGRRAMIGDRMNFAASEAYKLLRTKLKYSFADKDKCRVIGVSSALAGEGKSLTSSNLAFSLSELGERVLLVECDLRRPSLHEKLSIKRKPGLSGYLSGQNDVDNLIQYCGIEGDEAAFHVIAAGQNPPNPVELLSSERMAEMLNSLRQYYDYIILDLPPVGEVSDALAVTGVVDGFLLVVRQNYCNRVVLSSVIRQFEFVNAKILGIVCNYASDSTNGYGKKYYKYKYGKNKNFDYARAYENSHIRNAKKKGSVKAEEK